MESARILNGIRFTLKAVKGSNVSLSPDFMQVRVEAVKTRLNVQVCSLYRAVPFQETLEIVATSGLNQRALGATLSFDQGLTGKVAPYPQSGGGPGYSQPCGISLCARLR